MPKIELKNVYKIFGEDPQSVLPLLQEGATKEEILEEKDHTVGLDNVSLSIEEGETFVCMGLSGSGRNRKPWLLAAARLLEGCSTTS